MLRSTPAVLTRRPYSVEEQRSLLTKMFGDEYARIMCEASPAERRQYYAWMVANARRAGVPDEPSYSVGWMLEVEQEFTGEVPLRDSSTTEPL